MEKIIVQFKHELGKQFHKTYLEKEIWFVAAKIHVLFSAMEKQPYAVKLNQIATREEMKSSSLHIKATLNSLMKELEESVPQLKGVFLDDVLKDMDSNDLYKLLLTFERFGLQSRQYKNEQSVIAFFNALIEEYFSGKKIIDTTPQEIIELMIKTIKPVQGSVYDGTAGIGNLLVHAYEYAKKNDGNVTVYGQEIDEQFYKIGKLHLFLHHIIPRNGDILLGDTIQDPKWVHHGQVKQFEYVLMNYTFGVRDWGYEYAKNDPYGRFDLYGIPAKNQGDYAFIIHALSSLNSKGKGAIIVPFGILIRGAGERKIRSILVKDDVIESIVVLPDNLFAGTGIQVVLLILNKKKEEQKKGKIQFVLAEDEYEKTRTKKYLEKEHIDKIVQSLDEFIDDEPFSKIVTVEEIAENNYDLNPSLYFENIDLETEFGKVKFNRKEYMKAKNLKRISDIADVIRGVNLPSKQQLELGEGEVYPVIQIRDIEEGEIIFERIEQFPIVTRDVERVIAKRNDILVSSRGTQLKIAVVPDIEETILVSSMFVIIRLKTDEVEPDFIKRVLESPIGQYYFEATQSGSVVTVLTPNDIKSIEIPLLSKKEQRQFVDKLNDADEMVKKALEKRKHIFLNSFKELNHSISFY